MINLSASGGSVTFEFIGNSGYLQDGTITVPVNSLSMIIDESDMVTFKKPNNDVFLSALVSDFGMSKNELIAWYKANMVDGGITIDSAITSNSTNAVQSSAIFDKVTINVEESGSTSGSDFSHTYTFTYADGVNYFKVVPDDDSWMVNQIKYKSSADGEEKTISSVGDTDDYTYTSGRAGATITMKGNNHLTSIYAYCDGMGYGYSYNYNTTTSQWLKDYVSALEARVKILEQNNT